MVQDLANLLFGCYERFAFPQHPMSRYYFCPFGVSARFASLPFIHFGPEGQNLEEDQVFCLVGFVGEVKYHKLHPELNCSFISPQDPSGM